MNKEKLKLDSKHLEPVVIIGKKGLTMETVQQIKQVLKKKQVIKVKFLRSYLAKKLDDKLSRKEIAQEIANSCNAILVDHVGLTVSLGRKY